VHVRALVAPDEMAGCVSLYESIFELGSGDGSLNTRLLTGVARNGGIVVGAFNDDVLIGFTFSFLARDDSATLYQYSQVACVQRGWQGQGVGRRLKLTQREITIASGITEIRWAFDPFQIKNAYFNLDVLGARVHELVRNLYGAHGHGLDAPDSTNRVIAVWTLDAPHVRALSSVAARAAASRTRGVQMATEGLVRVNNDSSLLSVPVSFKRMLDEEDVRVRQAALASMERFFDEGFEAVSCTQVSDDVAYYTLTRRESVDA
jgi:predicted GNAT superfamily acetyltransferase